MAYYKTRKLKSGGYSYRLCCSVDGVEVKKTISSKDLPVNFESWSAKKKDKLLKDLARDFGKPYEEHRISTDKWIFKDYAIYVIDFKYKSGELKLSTKERYEDLLTRICDESTKGFGLMYLNDIRATHLNVFYQEMLKPGAKKRFDGTSTGEALSAKTIRELHRVTSMVLAMAEKEDLVLTNVARKATPPKVAKSQPRYYNKETMDKIISALDSEPIKWRTFIYLAADSGARNGELVGLKWSDIKGNRIHIQRNVQRSNKEHRTYIDTPKTGKDRWVTLTPTTLNLLNEYRNENGVTKLDGFIFYKEFSSTNEVLSSIGEEPMNPDTVACFLKRFSKRHNLEHLNIHAFRHTCVSALISEERPVTEIADRVGHQDVRTTLSTYSHLFDEKAKESQSPAAIEKAFFTR